MRSGQPNQPSNPSQSSRPAGKDGTDGTTVMKFWKPYEVLTKFTDPDGRATLADFISQKNIYPIGRLDRDSEGLLLLTNDGQLSARLTDPKYGHPRTYFVQVEHQITEAALRQLSQGVQLNDGPTRPATAIEIDEPDFPPRVPPIRERKSIPTSWISLTLTEGRNRQVRRMTAAVGYPTLRLVRYAVGSITLNGLGPGTYEMLSAQEIAAIRPRPSGPRRPR